MVSIDQGGEDSMLDKVQARKMEDGKKDDFAATARRLKSMVVAAMCA